MSFFQEKEVKEDNMFADSLDMAKAIADVCYQKLGKDTVVLDISKDSVLCDYFVICDAPTRNQLRDIAENIDKKLSEQGIEPKSIQGKNDNAWTLMDYSSVIVHLFISGERSFYNLEGMWKSAPIVYAPDAEEANKEEKA